MTAIKDQDISNLSHIENGLKIPLIHLSNSSSKFTEEFKLFRTGDFQLTLELMNGETIVDSIVLNIDTPVCHFVEPMAVIESFEARLFSMQRGGYENN